MLICGRRTSMLRQGAIFQDYLFIFQFVTASSGTAISTVNFDMFRNFVKISFKFDVALKHAQDEVPAKKAPQKIRNRRPRRTGTGDD